jgi:ribosomal protein S18 acetylase RimI-like enzyme
MGPGVDIRVGDRVLAAEYRALREGARWSSVDAPDAALQNALDGTWNVTARDSSGGLVGLVRLLDDGVLYASVWDMIVAPDFQRRGLGTQLLQAVLDRTQLRQLVSLVATPAGSRMYRNAGFAKESRGSVPLVWRRSDERSGSDQGHRLEM